MENQTFLSSVVDLTKINTQKRGYPDKWQSLLIQISLTVNTEYLYIDQTCNQKGHLLSFWVKQSMQAAEINKIAYM